MSIVNSLGISSSAYGAPGTRGPQGRGISSIQSIDNDDGSVTVNYTMSDGTTEGPFSNTLTSDALIADKINLQGTARTDKLTVENEADTVIFSVDTVNTAITLAATTTVNGAFLANSITAGSCTLGNVTATLNNHLQLGANNTYDVGTASTSARNINTRQVILHPTDTGVGVIKSHHTAPTITGDCVSVGVGGNAGIMVNNDGDCEIIGDAFDFEHGLDIIKQVKVHNFNFIDKLL